VANGQQHRLPGQVGAPISALMDSRRVPFTPKHATLANAKVAPALHHSGTPSPEPEPVAADSQSSALDQLRTGLGDDVVSYLLANASTKNLIENWLGATGAAKDAAAHKLAQYIARNVDKPELEGRILNEIEAAASWRPLGSPYCGAGGQEQSHLPNSLQQFDAGVGAGVGADVGADVGAGVGAGKLLSQAVPQIHAPFT
jgi:hypothetical protein